MSRKLLVLAASRYQVETITRARELGFFVVTLDNRPDNPGHRLADKSYDIDTTDMEAVLEAARREGIQGVIAPCTDVAVPTAAYVAERLGLKGPSLESTRITCSKTLFRKFLRSQNQPAPEFLEVNCASDPPEGLFDNREWILKPERSSGSKGVFIVRSKHDLLRRLPETLSFSPDGRGILERYIHGAQGTCEGFFSRGELAFACILDRLTAAPPYVTTRGHYLPSTLEPGLGDTLFTRIRHVWSVLGITDGPFDCDFVATPDEVYLLEMSPRMGGNCISDLLHKSLGFDLVEHGIRHAMGEDFHHCGTGGAQPAAVLILGVSEGGELSYDVDEAEALRKEPWVDSLSFDLSPGSPVAPFINSRNRVGQALIFGKNRPDLEARAQELRRRLQLRTTPVR